VVAALVLDAVDQTVFETYTRIDLAGYQGYDKAFDVYYLMIAYASTIRNWGGGYAFLIARALWYYRLLGVVLFEYLHARWLLVAFPNTFEYFFLAIELIKVSRNPFLLTKRRTAGIAVCIWVFVKLPQEWWLHIARLDFTDFVKERLFGASPDARWLDAVTRRPLTAVAGVAALVLVVAVARAWLARHPLPPRDWPPTWSADVQGKHLGWPTPSRRAVPSPFFGWALVEKATLVTAVTLVFARILPGTHHADVIAVGTASITVASTFISQALARRGVTWRSTAMQFGAMAATNTVLGFAAGRLSPARGTRPPLGTFLFLIGLLTLTVVLFDRYTRVGRTRSAMLDARRRGRDGEPMGDEGGR
jgi:hypothetical protein